MKHEYKLWIDANYPTPASAYSHCDFATEEMVKSFPELKRVRGHVMDGMWGEREHWWCIDPDGNIVDPTRKQFPALFHYVPWDESKGEPPQRRTCPDCGESHHGEDAFCNDRCRRRYAAYLAGGAL